MGKIELDHTGSGSGVTLSSDGTDLLLDGTAIGGGGGADLYAANESSPTAQPSATGGNAIAIGDSSTAAGADGVAIGLQAFARAQSALGLFGDAQSTESICIGKGSAVSADGAVQVGRNGYATAVDAVSLGRSRAGGGDSFAAVIDNNTSSYGATGSNSIAMGIQAKASSARGVAIGGYATSSSTSIALSTGWNNLAVTASGSNSVAIGGNTSATSPGSFAFGQQSSSAIRGKYAYAAGRFAANGDAQGGQFILRCSTTDATPTLLRTNPDPADSGNQIVALSDTCIMFSGTLVAMQDGAQDQGGWEIKGLLKNDGGTTTLVSSNIQTFADGNGWTVGLTADNTNNALAITCTGESAHNIRWVANISTSEVTYA